MDQCNAELGAHQGQVVGTVVGAVIDIQSLREASSQDRLLEYGQKRLGVLRMGESSMRDEARGIIQKADEIALAPSAPGDGHGRAVHHIAHPQLPGTCEGKAAAVLLARLLGAPLHQAVAGEQAVHARGRQVLALGHRPQCAGLGDDQTHRQRRVVLLDREQLLGDGGRDRPWGATIGARLG